MAKPADFVCENYGAKFTLPGRGPIGANCLANPRDFKTPVAWFEDRDAECGVTVKWCGEFHRTEIDHSPLDVVAWHGNYAPYKYDLRHYAAVGSITFDHPDPSIFTVLTAPTAEEGTANIDFVIFPPRWLPQENTFRPPWYHKNIMSELMGNIYGQYDAKPQGLFLAASVCTTACCPTAPMKTPLIRPAIPVTIRSTWTTRCPLCLRPVSPNMVTDFASQGSDPPGRLTWIAGKV